VRITVSRSTGATRTQILRTLGDNDERRLIINSPWQQTDSEIIGTVWNQLTAEEQVEVAAAFGLDQPGGAA
jgi:hypothetical protein